ncbi:MAG: TetR/AcrR family transcriptional regulator [Defluviitaleaceae bacterium]|nr:TetR/AcrR family transcriptional regulator [Defluviitaleaceae bacterium]MCL2203814.1 TetR/AcrR family transcriptional regulator [Defluviitaleaceae bacterium]MCL2239283.1 TetR/AcrR family transcriptional regulator [Defluviitaleaceae bacterium]
MAFPRSHFERKREDKQRKILDAAKRVFCRKGFLAVKMQDIINECGISRGGIYIYYASVDEVFLGVVKRRNKEGITSINASVDAREPFEAVFGAYMAKQKERLINFENSLFRAYCEYIFSRPKTAVHAFRDTQLNNLRESVEAILHLGASQGAVDAAQVTQLAIHVIAVVDGLSILALGDALTEDIVDAQFGILMKIIKKGDVSCD